MAFSTWPANGRTYAKNGYSATFRELLR